MYQVLVLTGPEAGVLVQRAPQQLVRPKGVFTRPMLKAWLQDTATVQPVEGVKGTCTGFVFWNLDMDIYTPTFLCFFIR